MIGTYNIVDVSKISVELCQSGEDLRRSHSAPGFAEPRIRGGRSILETRQGPRRAFSFVDDIAGFLLVFLCLILYLLLCGRGCTLLWMVSYELMIAIAEPHVWDLTSAVIEPNLKICFCNSV